MVANSFLSPTNAFAAATTVPTENSYVDPTKTVGAPTSPLVSYKPNEFSYLQPLVSDLLTTKTTNSFSRPKLVGDPNAIKERLGQYNTYSAESLGGLADYFKQKAAAVGDGNIAIKPQDFETLSSGLGGLSEEQYKNYSPMLSGLSSIGSLGGQHYFDKTKLADQLAKYGSVDEATAKQMVPLLGGLAPSATFGGNTFFDKDAMLKQLGNYRVADLSSITVPEVQAIKPIATVNGKNFYSPDVENQIKSAISRYGTLPDNLFQRYKDNPNIVNLNPVGTVSGTKVYDPNQLSGALSQASLGNLKNQLGFRVYNQGYTDPNAYRSILSMDTYSSSYPTYLQKASDRTDAMYNWMANQLAAGNTPQLNQTILDTFGRGAGSTAADFGQLGGKFNALYGYEPVAEFYRNVANTVGISQAEMDNVARMVASQKYRDAANSSAPAVVKNGYYYTTGKPKAFLPTNNYTEDYVNALNSYVEGKYGKALPGELVNSIKSSGNQLSSNMSNYVKDYNMALEKQRQDNSFSGAWNEAWGPLAPYASILLKFTPLAPVSYLFDAAMAAENKNWGGLVGSALGAYGGFTGSNPVTDLGSSINSGLNLGLSSTPAINALGSGVLGAGTSLASGKSPLDALKMGGLGALGSYGSSLLNTATTDWNPVSKALASSGMSAGLSGLGAALNKGSVLDSMQLGALSSLANSGLGALGQYTTGTPFAKPYQVFSGVTNPLIKQALAKQIKKR